MVPAPKAPADPVRAVAAGLLNLTGLGAGYLLLRRWVLAGVCLAATAALLVLALPAEPDGVPAGLLVAYGLLLLVAALDAARRAATTPLRNPVVAMVLGIVLLAVPAGGVVAYGAARDDAVEEMLLGRLDDADALVAKAAARTSFAEGRADYTTALARYRELAHDHAGSKAAELVPDRLDAYYKAVAKPYTDKKDCEAIEPLTYLRTVPGEHMDRDVLGSLTTWPDKPLAASLYACGTGKLGAENAGPDGGELGRLLRTFPKSEQAGRVGGALRDAVAARDRSLGGTEPCTARDELRSIGRTADALPDDAGAGVAADVDTAVEKGVYACGVDEFKDKKFGEARKTLADFADTYKNSKHRARAEDIAIAAEIAGLRPAAGNHLPPAGSPGGARMTLVVSNDGPGPVEVLYTGPVTGSVKLAACGSCTMYASESAGRSKACKANRKYPKATIRLPAGSYHFLHKHSADTTAAISDRAAGSEIRPGYSYTQCSYVVRGGGL